MRVTYNQEEIVEAVIFYMRASGVPVNPSQVSAEFTAGRKGAGITVELEITDVTPEHIEVQRPKIETHQQVIQAPTLVGTSVPSRVREPEPINEAQEEPNETPVEENTDAGTQETVDEAAEESTAEVVQLHQSVQESTPEPVPQEEDEPLEEEPEPVVEAPPKKTVSLFSRR